MIYAPKAEKLHLVITVSEATDIDLIILEWTKPGIWIEGLEEDAAWRIGGQIQCLEAALLEANVALNMFDQATASDQTEARPTAELEVRRRISCQVEKELFPDRFIPMGMPSDRLQKEYNRRRSLVDTKVRHEMWQKGFLPRSLLTKRRFICAKAFIHALDLFDKFLSDITEDPVAPQTIKDIHEEFCVELPDLRGVRNSIQHAEDRSKGEKFGKKIELKKIDTSKVGIEGTALVNLALNRNMLGTTMADGNYGAIEVSVQTIEIMRSALLDVYSKFAWKGPQQLYPT